MIWLAGLAQADTVVLTEGHLAEACARLQPGDVLELPSDRVARPGEDCFLRVGATVRGQGEGAEVGGIEVFETQGVRLERLRVVGPANLDAALYINTSSDVGLVDVQVDAGTNWGLWVQDSQVEVQGVRAEGLEAGVSVLALDGEASLIGQDLSASLLVGAQHPVQITLSDSALGCVDLVGQGATLTLSDTTRTCARRDEGDGLLPLGCGGRHAGALGLVLLPLLRRRRR